MNRPKLIPRRHALQLALALFPKPIRFNKIQRCQSQRHPSVAQGVIEIWCSVARSFCTHQRLIRGRNVVDRGVDERQICSRYRFTLRPPCGSRCTSSFLCNGTRCRDVALLKENIYMGKVCARRHPSVSLLHQKATCQAKVPERLVCAARSSL